ncbi:hypothetical protein ILYODFUR_029228 [Ilyodon furcidens]|uniref:Uncharacterized protein n=1 Tax=Ilyodon furcidens TaxID=33524 RepID=A0ABV0U9G9_9TELE
MPETIRAREELRKALGGQEVLPDDWTTTANAVRETGFSWPGAPCRLCWISLKAPRRKTPDSVSLLEPTSWKLRTILPSVRSPACPPSISCWKHLPKRSQVTERDTAFSTESHRLPNLASVDRFTLPGTFNSKSDMPSPIVLTPPDDQPNH